ncbi:MAG TPA: hypothetical protein ENH85_03125 [Candidatus Scalindua sp.]|nr:hypothetical protein [Candidatus Scalindua sp.]
MISLPPTEFTYGRYSLGIVPTEAWKSTDTYVKWILKQNIIGFCNSIEIEVRPRGDHVAIMIEEDGWQQWCHIPLSIWKKYLGQLKVR